MLINYPGPAMMQGSVDMADANRKVTELQSQFQTAMQALLAAWRSESGSPQLQQVQQLWVQANEEINHVLGRRGGALEDAWVRMARADRSAANALDI
ncbi:hypothetical protein [Kribbella sp. HUAS MG21]|jgi:uncharacterized protein YukE|uniref:WXG100 family type VII secretion target n=1 Tax=Kribbella sp. HUAS MG21 TaxID=3160966 RepID=A0AAU7THY1_9ACTN